MPDPITDTDLAEWLVDIESGCQPTAEAFRALVERCRRAEEERNWRRLAMLVEEHGIAAVREAFSR